jgi:hypothetical protein
VHSEAAFEAADGIATVPAFGSWGGDAAEAAKQASEQLRKDLDVHGSEALAVAKAAQRAADDMEQVKSDLAQLEADAAGDGFEVDRASSTVMPGPAMQGNMIDLIAAEAKTEDAVLQHQTHGLGPRLRVVLARHEMHLPKKGGAHQTRDGSHPTPSIAALDIQPTYSAREAAVLLGRSYSWLDQRLREDQFNRPDGTTVQPLRTQGLEYGLFRDALEFCSGLVDLVVRVRRYGCGCHGLATTCE